MSDFERWAAHGDLDAVVAYLMSGVHHGRPGQATAVKRQAVKALRRAGDAARRTEWALALAGRDAYVARELACALLEPAWPRHQDVMLRLADDEDWEVRESAAGLLHRVLASDFQTVLEGYRDWVAHGSTNVRRAVALAAKYAAQDRRPEQAEPLLSLVEPLLSDRAEYVRKNLGPFAIGDGLLRCFPEPTLVRLRLWSGRQDEATRWNVAMAFSAAAAAAHVDTALDVLEGLAADPRRFVWRAVASACGTLLKRQTAAVQARLHLWLEDGARTEVARTVLKKKPA